MVTGWRQWGHLCGKNFIFHVKIYYLSFELCDKCLFSCKIKKTSSPARLLPIIYGVKNETRSLLWVFLCALQSQYTIKYWIPPSGATNFIKCLHDSIVMTFTLPNNIIDFSSFFYWMFIFTFLLPVCVILVCFCLITLCTELEIIMGSTCIHRFTRLVTDAWPWIWIRLGPNSNMCNIQVYQLKCRKDDCSILLLFLIVAACFKKVPCGVFLVAHKSRCTVPPIVSSPFFTSPLTVVGVNLPRNVAMCQQRQERRRLLTSKHTCRTMLVSNSSKLALLCFLVEHRAAAAVDVLSTWVHSGPFWIGSTVNILRSIRI